MAIVSLPSVSACQVDDSTLDQNQQNQLTLSQRAQTALANNQTFLNLTNPTNAQVLSQVRALTRQTNGLIRFLLNELDTIADS